MYEIATSGTVFKDESALPTGAGKESIGVEILRGLSSGPTHVVIITSQYHRPTVELVNDIYATQSMDLHDIPPFAATPHLENGLEFDILEPSGN